MPILKPMQLLNSNNDDKISFCHLFHCRVPLRSRGAQQRITPDVQTGCISCASGDGRFGGPVWWNTPMGEDDASTADEHRATWGQDGAEPPSRKRPAAEVADDEDELAPDVRQRLSALKD